MKVTSYQLRAARSMIGLTVSELADLAHVSRDTVSDFEADIKTPQKRTVEALWRVLDTHGVELIGTRGVAMRDQAIHRLSGSRAMYDFFDDVYTTVMHGGAVCVTGVDENLFDKHSNTLTNLQHAERMTALGDALSMRCILREGDFNLACDSYIHYRWMTKDKFDPSPLYVYNHKLAMLDLAKDEPDIIIIESHTMAQAFRKQFDFIWEHCKDPPRARIP